MNKLRLCGLSLLAFVLCSLPSFSQVITVGGPVSASQLNGAAVPVGAPSLGTDANGRLYPLTPAQVVAAGSDPTKPTYLGYGQPSSGSASCSSLLSSGALPSGMDGMYCDNAGVWSYFNGTAFVPVVRSVSGSGVSVDASGNVTVAGVAAAAAPRVVNSATDTLQASDCTALGNTVIYTYAGAVTVTVPSGSGFTANCRIFFKSEGGAGNSIVLTPASSTTIDNSANPLTVYNFGDGQLQFVSSGNWTGLGGYGVRGAGTLSLAGALTKVTSPGVVGPAVAGTDYATPAQVSTETTRATGAEGTNATAISTETTRAKGAESTNATSISTETTRATGAESTLTTNVSANASAITANATAAQSAANLTSGTIAGARLPVVDPHRYPSFIISSTGQKVPLSFFLEVGNSTVAAAGNRVEGIIGSGYLSGLQWNQGAGTNAMSCTSSTCTLNLLNSNADSAGNLIIKVGDPVNFTAYANSCLVTNYPNYITAASATQISFANTAGCPTTAPYTETAVVTNQWANCAQNGGTLLGYLQNTATCKETDALNILAYEQAQGRTPIYVAREYLINDLRTGLTSFQTALAREKQMFSDVAAQFPTIPMVLEGENSVNQDPTSAFETPVQTTVTSGAITAGTNTVSLATMPYSIWPGAGSSCVYKMPNGTPWTVTLDSGAGAAETVSVTGMDCAASTITFTNANAHAANFTVIATIATAAQVLTNALHDVYLTMMDAKIPNLTGVDLQEELYGRQAPIVATSGAYMINSLHANQFGQHQEGYVIARHLAPIANYNPQHDAERVPLAYYLGNATENNGGQITRPWVDSIDTFFSPWEGANARSENFNAPETSGVLRACVDPYYNDVLATGTVTNFTGTSIQFSDPMAFGSANSITSGDAIAVLGPNGGCFRPTSLSATGNGGYVTLSFTSGANPYSLQLPTQGAGVGGYSTVQGSTIAVMRRKFAGPDEVRYANNSLTYPYTRLHGYIAAAGTGTFTLSVIGGPDGIAASNMLLTPGDILFIQQPQVATSNTPTATTPTSPYTVPSTVSCTATTSPVNGLVCTDTANTNYASWLGTGCSLTATGTCLPWGIASTRRPDRVATQSTATQVVASSLISSSLTSPAVAQIGVSSTGGTLSGGVTQCYRISAYNALGSALPGTETCQATTSGGTSTQYMNVYWYPVANAVGYNVYGRTSGGELFMKQVTGPPTVTLNSQLAYLFADLNTITPAGALPTVDSSSPGVVTARMKLVPSTTAPYVCSATGGPNGSSSEGYVWYQAGSSSANGVYSVCQNQSGTYSYVAH